MADGVESSGEPAARRELLQSIERVLDEHAELRDVLTQLHDTAEPIEVRGLIERLDGLLEAHFAREEQPGGILPLITERSPRHRKEVAMLVDEHRAILAALRETKSHIGGGGPGEFGDGEVLLAATLQRLHEHDRRETDILSGVMHAEQTLAIERVEATPQADISPHEQTASDTARGIFPADSTALGVNLRRTAVDVVIPVEQMVLLDVTAGFHGLQEDTKKLLREINHRYVGWIATVDDLHRQATSSFPHYIAHPRAAEAVAVFCGLYAKAIEQATPAAAGETATRYLVYYLEKLVEQSGPRLPELLPMLSAALERLRALLTRKPERAIFLSSRLKILARLFLENDAATSIAPLGLDLAATALDEVYGRWLDGEDPVDWWRAQAATGDDASPPGPIEAISHGHLREARAALAAIRAGAAEAPSLFDLPDHAQVARGYLNAAACFTSSANSAFDNAVGRIRWLTRVLAVDMLATVHEEALATIGRAYLDVFGGADRAVVTQLVRETFGSLRDNRLASSAVAFTLITKIGQQAIETGDESLVDLVIDEILDLDFPTPGFAGFTEEWKVRVDPAHLLAIRCYLAIIETHPWRARRLLAALVVQLRAGGVFIVDTDLFQRDVSRLLDRDVGPVFHQLKHLLRTFPVYFNDIGAEGELREVSTRIDEIGGRQDSLCNFLRKQCHVESNPRLIDFVEEIARFWASGDAAVLTPYIPDALYQRVRSRGAPQGLRDVLRRLVEGNDLRSLFALDPAQVQYRLDGIPELADIDREKVGLLIQLRRLIVQKYELGHDDLIQRLRAFHRIPTACIDALERALTAQRREEALSQLIDILELLKEIAVSPERVQPNESIYHKRHIAAGIPSVYGRYREAKFEAMGLTFRIESLANVLLEQLVAEQAAAEVDRAMLTRVATLLHLTIRALRVDGCRARQLLSATSLLDDALRTPAVTTPQYADIFRLVSQSIEQLIRIRFLDVYEPLFERLLGRMVDRGILRADPGADRSERILKESERLLRDLIAQSFGLQSVDRLVGAVLRALTASEARLQAPGIERVERWDPERCCIPIDEDTDGERGRLSLGSKGYLIARMARQGFPVPPGFLLTTDFFRCHRSLPDNDGLRRDMARCVEAHVARLERATARGFGDPVRPLLLSVRSGAAISMPGMLDTFLNVGINPEIATGLGEHTGSPWAAWDAYRRFLQFWGMSHGIARDRFDAVMRDAKQHHLVAKKSFLSPASMKEIALRYRQLLHEHRVAVADDPKAQLHVCIDMVIRSWDSAKARAYRGAMNIADDWGTGVIVQAMVFGNLSPRSGTGVVLTCDPRQPGPEVELYGDFTVQGQGDDVVSGLVETFPITDRQRRSEATRTFVSLECDFPKVYASLLRHARRIVADQNMFPQEIEFTFEGDRAEDLYLLQTRDVVRTGPRDVRAFVSCEGLTVSRVAAGIGVGGGALCGRVAHTAADISKLRQLHPDEAIILLRPDTVPDDIPLLLQVDGMVTGIGGATSHAAVAAQWLGRTCVVGCRSLHVQEDRGQSILAGKRIRSGDFLSIDGNDGSVYIGRHPITTLRRQWVA